MIVSCYICCPDDLSADVEGCSDCERRWIEAGVAAGIEEDRSFVCWVCGCGNDLENPQCNCSCCENDRRWLNREEEADRVHPLARTTIPGVLP